MPTSKSDRNSAEPITETRVRSVHVGAGLGVRAVLVRRHFGPQDMITYRLIGKPSAEIQITVVAGVASFRNSADSGNVASTSQAVLMLSLPQHMPVNDEGASAGTPIVQEID